MLKQNKFRIQLLFIIGLFTFIFGSTSIVEASNVTPRISQYYLAEGVGHVDYFITQSAEGYTTLINNAANSWVDTGYGWNPIYMYRTYNSSASNMDIHSESEGNLYANGYTTYFYMQAGNPVQVSPESSFWDYCDIHLNSYFLNNYDQNKIQGVIAHEMGHVFGLDENNSNTQSIMCQDASGRTVYKPGKADHDGINAMY